MSDDLPQPAELPQPKRRRPAGAARAPWGLPSLGEDENWERLSGKKLLLDPLMALKSMAIPIVAVAFGASTSGIDLWLSLALAGGLLLFSGFAVIPWFTQRYRVTDQRLQYRKGLFSTTMLSAPLDRVRSVDLEANLLHRILGLRNVQIGTGVDSDRIELNGMDVKRAEELRRYLLDRRTQSARIAAASVAPLANNEPDAMADVSAQGDTASPAQPTLAADDAPSEAPAPEKVLAVLNWKWLRFAPFDLTRLAVIAAAIGFFFQVIGEDFIPDSVFENLDDQAARILEVSIVVLIVIAVLGSVLSWIFIAVVGYVIQWWGLRLTSSNGSLHLTHGLLTTRSISVEEKRVRGVEIREPLLLRPVKGADLFTLATGVGSDGTTRILPQAPTPLVRQIGEQVAESHGLLHLPLTRHTSAARRRSHVREQWGTLFILAVGGIAHAVLLHFSDANPPLWWFLAPGAVYVFLAVIFAELAYAHLGHALTRTYFIVGSGTTARVRTALEVDGIIGWVVERSFFQRRLGLCTLIATTAAGGEKVVLRDVEESVALTLMQQSTPESVAPFLDSRAAV